MRLHLHSHPRRFHYAAMRDAESNSLVLYKIPAKMSVKTVPFTDPISSLFNDQGKSVIDAE
jgi:hypothetical protein